MRFRVLILCVALAVSACSRHHSPQQQNSGEKILFETDKEAEIANLVLEAISEADPNRHARDLKGPIRGYWTRRNWLLDYWSTIARIYAATGVTDSGKPVSGYYPEVTGKGTLIIRGPKFDNRLYRILMEKMEAFAPKIRVKELKRGTYRLTRKQWLLANTAAPKGDRSVAPKGAVPPSGTRSVEDRLKALEKLKTSNRISDAEYHDLRAKILNDL